ncbi:hypothetical protein HY490_00205, partial [Candidatus Woesearchaeota archaeon]|nr:hypothetical protein [Candidatus Woesearchaeota archaeon]
PGAQQFESQSISPGQSTTVTGLQPGRIRFGIKEIIQGCTPFLNPNHCGKIVVMEE